MTSYMLVCLTSYGVSILLFDPNQVAKEVFNSICWRSVRTAAYEAVFAKHLVPINLQVAVFIVAVYCDTFLSFTLKDVIIKI